MKRNLDETTDRPKAKFALLLIILAVIAVGSVATIGVTHQAITGLDENRKKLRQYDVKPSLTSVKVTPAYELADTFSKLTKSDTENPHPDAERFAAQGKSFESRHQWVNAQMCYANAIHAFERDWKRGEHDGADGVMIACRFADVARCLEMEGNFEAALAHQNAAIQSAPNLPALYSQRADILYYLNRRAEAKADRLKALQLQNHPVKTAAQDTVEQMFGSEPHSSAK